VYSDHFNLSTSFLPLTLTLISCRWQSFQLASTILCTNIHNITTMRTFRQGGVRVNAWVSGGGLPESMRGKKLEGLTTIWDWYKVVIQMQFTQFNTIPNTLTTVLPSLAALAVTCCSCRHLWDPLTRLSA
jgi:hypothetical protein